MIATAVVVLRDMRGTLPADLRSAWQRAEGSLSHPPAAAEPEADAVLVALDAQPEHVLEAQANVAVLAVEVVPALAAERALEARERPPR